MNWNSLVVNDSVKLPCARFTGRAVRWLFLALALPASLASQANVLFRDDFNQTALDATEWSVASWQLGRSLFNGAPALADGVAHLTLQTYNPIAPGVSLLGTEIFTLRAFERGNGLEISARLRFSGVPDGAVASIFTYERDSRGATDEIDFEFLTKQTNHAGNSGPSMALTHWNDWTEADGYGNGPSHWTTAPTVAGLDLRAFNTFTIRWLPTQTQWMVNGVVVASSSEAVPDSPAPLHLNFWAPGSSWDEAFSAALQPTSDPRLNHSFSYDVDDVVVSSIPEPPSLWMAALGLIMLASWRSLARRRGATS